MFGHPFSIGQLNKQVTLKAEKEGLLDMAVLRRDVNDPVTLVPTPVHLQGPAVRFRFIQIRNMHR